MYKALALLLGPLTMAAMVYSFGFMSILVCFALILCIFLLSNGPGEGELEIAMAREHANEPPTVIGAI